MPADAVSSTKCGGPSAAVGVATGARVSAKPAPATSTTITAAARIATLRRFTWSPDRLPLNRRPSLGRGLPVVVALREDPRRLAAGGAQLAPGEVVDLDVDASPQPGLARLVGGVVVGCPLEPDVGGRANLELERAGLDRVPAAPTREVLAPGEADEHLRGGPAERAVPGRVRRERRRDERGELVGNPGRREDPRDPADLGFRVLRMAGPGPDRDLALVAHERRVALPGRGRRLRHELDEARDERKALGVVGRQRRVARLAEPAHVPDERERARGVVGALEAPRRDRRIVERTVEGEVQLDVPLEAVDGGTGAADPQVRGQLVGREVGE